MMGDVILMHLVTAMIFLLSFLSSFFVFLFINSKLNVEKWFNQNNMRKIIAVLMTLVIYTVGIMLLKKFNVVGNYNAILRGILVSTVVTTVVVVKVSKIRKVDK